MDRRELLRILALGSVSFAPLGLKSQSVSSDTPIKPKRIAAGDTIGLVSPSGITRSRDKVAVITETLDALGLKIKVDEHAMDRYGYLAGTDRDRAKAINQAFADPEIDGILTFIGGWGCARLLPLLDYELIGSNPKFIMGFSDITALLIAIYAKSGLVTYHGPSGRSTWNQFSVDYVRKILFEGEKVVYENPQRLGDNLALVSNRTVTITPGLAQGRLVGGNLTVLTALMGSSYLPDFRDHILFVEDIGEGIYRIDRMMTQLKLAGVLDQISGFIFGHCTDCDPDSGISSFTLEEVLEQHIKPLGIPAFRGAMIGHISDKFTVPVGIRAEMDADSGSFRLLEAPVS
jgi:muramoyltetrapeptide carboxypeptidase